MVDTMFRAMDVRIASVAFANCMLFLTYVAWDV